MPFASIDGLAFLNVWLVSGEPPRDRGQSAVRFPVAWPILYGQTEARPVRARWARRVVRAIDEDGGSELLFTDVPLEPGQVYLMHPLTNPLRVDPILVPAGDLVWPEGKG